MLFFGPLGVVLPFARARLPTKTHHSHTLPLPPSAPTSPRHPIRPSCALSRFARFRYPNLSSYPSIDRSIARFAYWSPWLGRTSLGGIILLVNGASRLVLLLRRRVLLRHREGWTGWRVFSLRRQQPMCMRVRCPRRHLASPFRPKAF